MARSIRRSTLGAAALGLVILMTAGCGRDADPPAGPAAGATSSVTPAASASPSPSVTAAPSPSPTVDPAIVFAADGIGDYIIGKTLSELSGKLTGIVESELCADSKGAEATGRYAGQLTFSFYRDRLVSVHTTSTALVTPSGAKVGMTLRQVQDIYGSRGTLITGTLGNKAFIVRVPASGLAVVFFLDPTNTRVASMSGGEAQRLEDAARAGEGC